MLWKLAFSQQAELLVKSFLICSMCMCKTNSERAKSSFYLSKYELYVFYTFLAWRVQIKSLACTIQIFLDYASINCIKQLRIWVVIHPSIDPNQKGQGWKLPCWRKNALKMLRKSIPILTFGCPNLKNRRFFCQNSNFVIFSILSYLYW